MPVNLILNAIHKRIDLPPRGELHLCKKNSTRNCIFYKSTKRSYWPNIFSLSGKRDGLLWSFEINYVKQETKYKKAPFGYKRKGQKEADGG
jgi:hypothetical protein